MIYTNFRKKLWFQVICYVMNKNKGKRQRKSEIISILPYFACCLGQTPPKPELQLESHSTPKNAFKYFELE